MTSSLGPGQDLAAAATAAWAARKLPETITVRDVAEGLARIPRWVGQTAPGPFSVAQHSCLVSGEVYKRTSDPLAAAYAHLHDGHEFITGDVPADLKALIAEVCLPRTFMALLEGALDIEIFRGAGLSFPMPAEIAAIVKQVDRQVAATEIRDLNVTCVDATLPEPLPTPIVKVLTWDKAEDLFVKTWDRFAQLAGLPDARGIR